MAEFIDRAKLEALAEEHSKQDANWHARELARKAFLAGAAAYAALLDAETTEEWGVRGEVGGFPFQEGPFNKAFAEQLVSHGNRELVSRRVAVTPWFSPEGGES